VKKPSKKTRSVTDDEHVAFLKQGATAWNAWRHENPDIRPNLSEADFIEANLSGADLRGANLIEANLRWANLSGADLSEANLWRANLSGANLTGAILKMANLIKANLSGANLSGANLSEADFSGANLWWANLRWANLSEANFSGAEPMWANLGGANLKGANLVDAKLRQADLSEANLSGANLRRADLSEANLSGADLRGANLIEANLSGANLSGANLTDADLTGCRVYGASAWGLKLQGAKQQDLIVTHPDEPEITVDNIELAQFIYLLLHNQKIRDVIDTITSKAVLILGRFTDERKAVLDTLREELRNRKLLPILFNFATRARRDMTETIKTLASLARFVIADVTDAMEVRVELHNIVADFTSLPIQLILLRGHPEFVSLSQLTNFPWVLPIFEYDDQEHLLASLDKSIVNPVEDVVRKLRRDSLHHQPGTGADWSTGLTRGAASHDARGMRDPYEVLGVDRKASAADIKRAYRKLAKKLHRDTNKNDQKAAERIAELNAAYEILGEDDKRKAFDRGEIDAEGKPHFRGMEGFGGRARAHGGGFGGFEDIVRDVLAGASPGARTGGGFGGFEDIVRDAFARARARTGGGAGFEAEDANAMDRGLKRSLNAWISNPRPTAGEAFRVSINIGRVRGTAAAAVSFNEPEWGEAESMDLIVSVSCLNCIIMPSWQELKLPRTGESKKIDFWISARAAGNREFTVRVYLAKQMIQLQSLRFTVMVTEAQKTSAVL
jgi:uncharacterized protein YjbI with pentapeptide repeats/curved DNA-binding protein CbpA